MMRRTACLLLTISLITLAGCTDDSNQTDDRYTDSGPVDDRIPSLDDPGWQPFTESGVPREVYQQDFERRNFYQEPEAAEAEGNAGTAGFNLTQLDASIGPLEDGFVYNANTTFPPSWDIVFHDVNHDNRSILFEHMVDDGDHFEVDGLPGGVTVVIDEEAGTVAHRLELQEEDLFYVAPETDFTAAGFHPGAYHVTAVDETVVHLDHHPAGEEQQQMPQDPNGQYQQ